MPGFNKQGPDGTGAMTGRQRGMCRRTEEQAQKNFGSGCARGMGMGRGLGQGRNMQQGPGFAQPAELPQNMGDAGPEELMDLKARHLAAQQALERLEKKIAALEGGI